MSDPMNPVAPAEPARPAEIPPPAPGLWLTSFRLAAIWTGGAAVHQVAQRMLPTEYAMMADPTVFGSIGLGVGATVWGWWVRRKELRQRYLLARVADDAYAIVVSWQSIVRGWFGGKP